MANVTTSLAVEVTGRKSASLTWVDGASNSWVEIYRGTTNVFSAASFITMVAQATQQYQDTALEPGTLYYWWTKGRDSSDGLSATTGPVSVTTIGNAGNPGTDLVADIVAAFNGRMAAQLSTDFKALPYVRELEKNSKMDMDRGYGVMPETTEPGVPAMFGYYTQTHDFKVTLTRNVPPSKGDVAIATAEQELYQWFDRLVRDFKFNRLFRTDIIVRIGDPSAEKPDYMKDTQAVALSYHFPVTYRNTLN